MRLPSTKCASSSKDASSSKGTSTYDKDQFANKATHEHYVNIRKDKNFMKEKGFSYASEAFQRVINARGWKLFCKQPVKACALIVKEFYTNLNEKSGNNIYV